MKKNMLIVLIFVCLLFAVSCSKLSKEDENTIIVDEQENTVDESNIEDSDKNDQTMIDDEPEITDEVNSDMALKDSEVVSSQLLDYKYENVVNQVKYESPEIVYKAEPYDFSYEDAFNAEQFYGFTDKQIEMMNTNGFVVLEPNANYPFLRMHYVNEMSEYFGIPQFVSTDNVLHMFRTFYSESMKYLEMAEYYPTLVDLTDTMLERALNLYELNEDAAIQEDLLRVNVYLGVASYLLEHEVVLPEEVQVIVDQELLLIERKELAKSMLYHRDVDYSQYVIRGHYTKDVDYEKYFKAMMWYGQTGFQLTEEKQVNMDEVVPSLMLTLLSFENDNIDKLTSIYDLTNLYSGYADDILVYDLQEVLVDVYGAIPSYSSLRDEAYTSQLETAVLNLPEPQIIYKVDNLNIDMPSGKQFRLMGQRYTLDANILQELAEPIVRPVPTSFDVLTAFGHESAEEILYDYYLTNQNWDGYDAKLEDMKQLVEDFGEDSWQLNLYNGMLWAIDGAATSFEGVEGVPSFMDSHAWSMKNLSSALGNYAELKHDNILYSKQMVAEAGGVMYLPYNYVEPNVVVYSRLKWLTAFTEANLKERGVVDEDVLNMLTYMYDILESLESVSIKELAGETLTDDDLRSIESVCGLTDMIFWNSRMALAEIGYETDDILTSATIADIGTILGLGYLEVGSGMPYEIYVLCSVNGKEFIARGAVYSFYEFLSEERLTDEIWENMLGYERALYEGWDIEQLGKMEAGPSLQLLEQMPWMSEYISNEPNQVREGNFEVNWEE